MRAAHDRIRIPTLIVLALCLPAAAAASEAHDALRRLEQLVGEWHGTFAWTGVQRGSGEIRARYSLTGNGSTVVEELYHGGPHPAMTSLYHLDGADLRMTHFCAAGNQPRLRASVLTSERMRFDFVDITNLRAPEAGHVYGAELRRPEPDRLEIRFRYRSGAGESLETILLERASGAPPATRDR